MRAYLISARVRYFINDKNYFSLLVLLVFLEFTIFEKERKRNEEGTNVPFENWNEEGTKSSFSQRNEEETIASIERNVQFLVYQI